MERERERERERETLASVTRNTLHFLPSISISYLVKMMGKLKENK
jgi:hypothetical protein